MRTVTAALIQHASPVGQARDNLERAQHWTHTAASAGAALICLPELNITGHAGHPIMVSEAEPVPDGSSVRRLEALAKELGVYISAGLAEDDRGIHYNTQVLLGPTGYIGKQRKLHLSGDEYFFFRGGGHIHLFELPFARLGIVICYDSEIPEVPRALGVMGAEIILAPHAARSGNWPDVATRRAALAAQLAHWRLVQRCRASDSGVFVLACNTAGASAEAIDGVEANHPGGCMALDPLGQVIAESQSDDVADEMVIVTLDGDLVAQRRRQPCFNLQTRRPELFGILAAADPD